MPRPMEITTPFDGDTLLFHRMRAREELSRVSEYHLELLSEEVDLNSDDILGQNVTVTVELPDQQQRYFNGFVTRFSQEGTHGRYHRYCAVVRPWLWFLSRTADCRIFQEMTVPDILKQVFAEHGTADFSFELTGSYRTWNYCVQYRESDLDFVSRLAEHEGIYYYFRHTAEHHTLVLTDSSSQHLAAPNLDALPFIAPNQQAQAHAQHIRSWEFARQVQPGAYIHDSYDLKRPSVDLQAKKTVARSYSLSEGEVYDWSGAYEEKADGEQYADVRINELATQFETADAVTTARGVTVGCSLALEDHPRDDQNQEYLVMATNYDMKCGEYEGLPSEEATTCQCDFVMLSTKQQFRPQRLTTKPFVQGPQTAVVVGPSGDEIYTDEYGRVKCQFHWDRLGKQDENSSCWIRVSHPWAGKGWGAVATPRIGQEVIVSFLEGDPDRPIITGRVYNAEQTPPFGFPAGAVSSGIKSDTHKGSGYNEMSFDDTAGTEKVTIHGQYDMNTTVEHDQTSTIHNNRTDQVDVDDSETVGSNQSLAVGADRTKTVGANETITIGVNQTESVGANQSVTVGSNKTETVAIAKALTVGAAYQVTVGAAMNETVGAVKMEEIGGAKMVGVGAYSSEDVAGHKTVEAGGNISESAGGSLSASAADTMSLSSGADFSAVSGAKGLVAAADELVLECGSAKIILKSDGKITIKGSDLTLDGSGKIVVDATGDLNLKGSKINQNS